jgi:hypothetical protein
MQVLDESDSLETLFEAKKYDPISWKNIPLTRGGELNLSNKILEHAEAILIKTPGRNEITGVAVCSDEPGYLRNNPIAKFAKTSVRRGGQECLVFDIV